MELSICEGDYGLPSLDADCLRLLLLAKVAKVPLNVRIRQNCHPILNHDGRKIADCDIAVGYLQEVGFGIDYPLSKWQVCESYVFSRMVRRYLSPVVKYVWWIDEFNYENFTAKWFMSSGCFPFNLAALRRLRCVVNPISPQTNDPNFRNAAKELIELNFPKDPSDCVKNSLIKDFEECCCLFDLKLRKSKFFYGPTISSIDVLIYSYLAPLMKIPFPENEFKEVIESYPVLIRYVVNITDTYFPEVKYTEKYIKTAMFEEELEGNVYSLLFFGFLVSMAMIGMSCSKYMV